MLLFLIQLGHMCSISENIAMIKHYSLRNFSASWYILQY